MKRFLVGALGIVLLVSVGVGAIPKPAPPVQMRYMISAPLFLLKRYRLVPEQIVGRYGLMVSDEAGLHKLEQLKIPYEIREIGKIPIPDPFLDPQEIDATLSKLAVDYRDRAELVDLNQRFSTPLTEEGRRLYALRIRAPLTDLAPRPVVLMDSLHHARELITPMITMDAAQRLLSSYGKDPRITAWLNFYEFWIVPKVNPDGYAFVFAQEPLWRKNRRRNADGSFGVDLNRNYPFQWGQCGNSSILGSSDLYKGSSAASEREVQTMIALGRAIRPNLYLTYHSYGNEIIRPYLCSPIAEEATFQDVSQQMASSALFRVRKASSSGESFEHFYHQFGSLAFLVEVGSEFHPPVEQISLLVSQARKTWETLLDRGMQSALRGVVQNQQGQPVEASLSLDEVPFQLGEIRRAHPQNGRFFWVLAPGTYTFRVKASGYLDWMQKIVIPATQALSLVVQLQQATDGMPKPQTEPPPSQEMLREPNTARDGTPDARAVEPNLRDETLHIADASDVSVGADCQKMPCDGHFAQDANTPETPSNPTQKGANSSASKGANGCGCQAYFLGWNASWVALCWLMVCLLCVGRARSA